MINLGIICKLHFTGLFSALCIITCVFCSCDPDFEPVAENLNITVIENVNLFDGETYRERVNLVIKDSSLLSIGNERSWPEGAVVVDGSGKMVMPPFLNAHVHAWSETALKESMSAGIFGMLDMHNTDEVADLLRGLATKEGYARLYSSGPGATVPGGHGTQFGMKIPVIDGELLPVKFVQDRVRNHADYIKIFREPTMNTLSFSQTAELIGAAHQQGKLAVAHISSAFDAVTLARQRVDGLMHIWFNKALTKAEIDSLYSARLFVVPTLQVTKRLLEYFHEKGMEAGIMNFNQVLHQTKLLHERGIPILAGTDSPNFYFNYGTDYYLELELLAQAGMDGIEVLKAATSNIYKAFRLTEFGQLRPGSPASFLLINGNPCKNIADVRKLEAYWKMGKRRNGPFNAIK